VESFTAIIKHWIDQPYPSVIDWSKGRRIDLFIQRTHTLLWYLCCVAVQVCIYLYIYLLMMAEVCIQWYHYEFNHYLTNFIGWWGHFFYVLIYADYTYSFERMLSKGVQCEIVCFFFVYIILWAAPCPLSLTVDGELVTALADIHFFLFSLRILDNLTFGSFVVHTNWFASKNWTLCWIRVTFYISIITNHGYLSMRWQVKQDASNLFVIGQIFVF